jgi:outer membrane protein insertion porin family
MIKEIRILGLKRTKEYIVRRELISKVGDPFLEENLETEFSRLDLLDIFSKITIAPSLKEDGVVLTYTFVETFPFIPTVSVQITDENAVAAGGGFKTPNLFGRDIFLWTRLLMGGATTVEFWLVNPWVTGNHLGYWLKYYHRERDNLIGDFFETANEFSFEIGSYLGEYGRIGGEFEFTNIRSNTTGTTLSPDNSDNMTRVRFYLGYDSRDRFSDTRKGWWNELSIAKEFKIFKNSSNFYQVDFDIRRYQPLPFWDRHTLAVFSLLTLRTGEVGIDIAPWQQFGVGGTNTIRGWEYAYQKGKNQFVNTLEYRITVLRPRLITLPLNIHFWGGVQICLFGDFGIAWNQRNQFKVNNFISGYGVGLRILVPIVGMTRIDFGWGQKNKGIMLHLGGFEKPVLTRWRVR